MKLMFVLLRTNLNGINISLLKIEKKKTKKKKKNKNNNLFFAFKEMEKFTWGFNEFRVEVLAEFQIERNRMSYIYWHSMVREI